MWSRKPTPVLMSTYWDGDSWYAWVFFLPSFSRADTIVSLPWMRFAVMKSFEPPSILRAMWIFVSLVLRFMLPVRAG